MKKSILPISVSLTAVAIALMMAVPATAIGPCDAVCTCASSCGALCYIDILPFQFGLDSSTFGTESQAVEITDSVVTSTCGEYGKCVGNCPGQPTCGNLSCTTSIYGTNGGDTLNGTSSRECIYGYAGADTIYGQAGDDRIYAGDGNDTVYGGSGDDCLWGEAGDDYLSGDTGYDFADGGAGYDTCSAEVTVNCP